VYAREALSIIGCRFIVLFFKYHLQLWLDVITLVELILPSGVFPLTPDNLDRGNCVRDILLSGVRCLGRPKVIHVAAPWIHKVQDKYKSDILQGLLGVKDEDLEALVTSTRAMLLA